MTGKIIPAPKGLTADTRRVWAELCSIYDFSDPASQLLLRTALECRDTMQAARKHIRKDGITTKNRFGSAVPNPALAIENQARRGMLAALRDLGLEGGSVT